MLKSAAAEKSLSLKYFSLRRKLSIQDCVSRDHLKFISSNIDIGVVNFVPVTIERSCNRFCAEGNYKCSWRLYC